VSQRRLPLGQARRIEEWLLDQGFVQQLQHAATCKAAVAVAVVVAAVAAVVVAAGISGSSGNSSQRQ